MKKKAIALILAAVMALGSVSTASVLAADTTAQEAAPVEETTSEEAEDTSEEEPAQEETTETVESEPAQEETTEAVEEEPAQEETTEVVEEDSAQEETTEAVEEEPTQESDESVGSENTESTVEEEQTQEEDTAVQEEASDRHSGTITVPGTTETVSSDAMMSQVASGTCGTNLTWVLDDEGTLTISGTGEMYNPSGPRAFPWYSYRNMITSVVVSNGVASIGDYAFYECSNSSLTSVTIPDSVTSIGEYAFSGCSNLTSAPIGNGVTSIEYKAFNKCSSLTNVKIPDSVTSIGGGAFQDCSRLTRVILGKSVTSIGSLVFVGCGNLTSIDVVSDNSKYVSVNGVLLSKNNTTLIQYPNGKSENSYAIPSGVTSIGIYAFYECSSLTSVTIPDSVTSIGGGAFSLCSSLTNVKIPDSVTSIGGGAFSLCSSLTNVKIPDSVTSIGDNAFSLCSSLTSVTIPDSVTSIGGDAFRECSRLTNVTIGNGVTSIESYTFSLCSSLTSVTIPDSVTSIGIYAFYKCSSLTSITIPDSVTWIGGGAFSDCPNLVVFTNNEYVIQYCKNNNIEYCTCVTEFYPEIGATNVDHNSEHLFFIDFAYNFVPNGGYAYLYESGKTECVDKIHIYDPSTDANASTDNDSSTDDNASEIGFRYGYGNTQNGLELQFSINKLQKGKKYSIAIDSDAIRFVDDNGDEIGVEFPGLKKDVWTFTTVDLDYFSFTNPDEFVVPLRLYTKLFGPIESARLRAFRSHGEDGLCFGLDYLVGLNKLGKGYILEYLVNASKNLSELGKSELTNIKAISLDYSLLEYLQLAFIYQYSEGNTKESKDNKNKYDKLYEAVKNCSNSPITIGIKTDGGYHAIYPITVLKDSSDYCEVLVYDSTGYTFSEGDHVGLFTYLQKLKINKSNGKCTGVEYQNDSGKTVTYRTISNLFDYTIGNVSPIYMVSCERIPGEYDGLYPIESTNGDSAVSQEERYLYWLEGNTFDVILSEDNTLSLTDGYDEIEVTASAGASVNLDIENITAKVENTNASENVYTITHTYAVNDDNFKSVVIKGETSSTVNTKKTEDGIIVTNEDGTPVEATVSLTENDEEVQTVDVSADTDSINIKYNDNNTVTVTEDTDSDGTYETVIAGEESKKITDAVISGISNKTYTGSAITQSAVVTYEGKQLVEGTDYTASYKNNTNAGTATVTITGKGSYTGTVDKTFTIAKANQNFTVKAAASSINVGKTTKVTVSGAKETNKYTFTSSNTKVATVNSAGTVTGKAAGTVTITVKTAATANYKAGTKTVKITVTANKSLKKPGNCHFAKWNNAKYTSCRIAWNKVAGAEGYQTLLSWTNGTHASSTIVKSSVLYRNCTVHPQHVSQMKVRAFYMQNGKRKYGPWSNVEYITPSPTKLTTKNASKGSNLKMNISWNIIYGCNGYNVFITTNPNGKWYWNQSTPVNAKATKAVITKYRGSKLKKNTRYYVRIVTRRKRNGVFCTVPMPAANTNIGSFIIK